MTWAIGDIRDLTVVKACGGCTACCTVIPVSDRSLQKPAYKACPHLRDAFTSAGPGCGIYNSRPASCHAWACTWLTSPDLPPALRPDRCGVVIDPVVDLIRVNGKEFAAAQFWAAEGAEDAYQRDIVAGAIRGCLDQVPAVLWRQRGADGTQWARVIMLSDDGYLNIGPLTKSDANLGTEADRWARVDQIMSRKGR